MATVTGLTSARMLEIEAASVISGFVDVNGNLLLAKHDGAQINAGNVIGPQGPTGPTGPTGATGTLDSSGTITNAQLPVPFVIPPAQSSTMTIYRDVLSQAFYSSADAIVVKTPITKSSSMTRIRIVGYNYTYNYSSIDVTIDFYCYTATVGFVNFTYRSIGGMNVKVSGGYDSTGKVVLVLQPASLNSWSYPHITVAEVDISFGARPLDWNVGWSAALESFATWSVYTGIADAFPETASGEPAGVIKMFAGAVAPVSYLLCVGSSYTIVAQPLLFDAIGYTYGGSGSSFNVPDFRGRTPVGLDSSQSEFNSLGEAYGAKTHTLTVAQMPSHTHTLNMSSTPGSYASTRILRGDGPTAAISSIDVNETGSNVAHNIVQPSRVINFIIKT